MARQPDLRQSCATPIADYLFETVGTVTCYLPHTVTLDDKRNGMESVTLYDGSWHKSGRMKDLNWQHGSRGKTLTVDDPTLSEPQPW
jgi:hypothetical protein